jgi:hypothetical protein
MRGPVAHPVQTASPSCAGCGCSGALIDEHHDDMFIAISAHMSSWVPQLPRTQPPP